MTRTEWIDELKNVLSQELPENIVKENIDYYRCYIEDESKRDSEEEVLSRLGNPRLIAHTIIDTYAMKMESNDQEDYGYQYYDSVYENGQTASAEKDDDHYRQKNNKTRIFYSVDQIKWYHKALFFIILFLILTLIIIVGSAVISILLRFGLPILLIYMMFQWLRRR